MMNFATQRIVFATAAGPRLRYFLSAVGRVEFGCRAKSADRLYDGVL
jgi:hypothetical protein